MILNKELFPKEEVIYVYRHTNNLKALVGGRIGDITYAQSTVRTIEEFEQSIETEKSWEDSINTCINGVNKSLSAYKEFGFGPEDDQFWGAIRSKEFKGQSFEIIDIYDDIKSDN